MRPTSNLATALLFIVASHAAAIEPTELYGTWRLVNATSTVVATGEMIKASAPDYAGVLTYGRDGRVSAILIYGPRPKPIDLAKVSDGERLQLYRTSLAYAGTFGLEGNVVQHHIDISSNETWTGTTQVRYVKFEGATLVISTPPQPRSKDGAVSIGELRWEKVTGSISPPKK